VNTLILNGDFSIAGVNEQLSVLALHLAGVAVVVPGAINRHIPYDIATFPQRKTCIRGL
jgi:hypothetical protein